MKWLWLLLLATNAYANPLAGTWVFVTIDAYGNTISLPLTTFNLEYNDGTIYDLRTVEPFGIEQRLGCRPEEDGSWECYSTYYQAPWDEFYLYQSSSYLLYGTTEDGAKIYGWRLGRARTP